MLYFIRHGQTDWNLDKKIQGITDIPLNEKGQKQAYDAVDKIAHIQWKFVISSPLKRAFQTAEILCQRMGYTVRTDQRLCELGVGDLEGKPLNSLTPEVWKMLAEDPQKLNAEGLKPAYDRIQSFMQEIDNGADTLIVLHSGIFKVISYYMAYQNGFDYGLFAPYYRDLWIPNTTLISSEVEPPRKVLSSSVKYDRQIREKDVASSHLRE